MESSRALENAPATFGNCARCARRHSLPTGQAGRYASEMMLELSALGRLDYLTPEDGADPRLSLPRLFHARGNMFGVLECENTQGESVFLRAFSSLSGGIRDIPGWVLPILSADIYEGLILPQQQEIKDLTVDIESLRESGQPTKDLEEKRRGVSQALWAKMCAEYQFQNFRGEEKSLADAVYPGSPITGGMGECCAPKLLNHAARNQLRPRGIAEFYWRGGMPEGQEPDRNSDWDSARTPAVQSKRRTRKKQPETKRISGEFYPSCEARCQPLLGFLLCGLSE